VRRDHWREDALCVGQPLEVFFPAHTLAEDRWDKAKLVCEKCTVKKQCLKLVIDLPEDDDRWGVFGGLSPADRRVKRDKTRRGVK
jgi:WhiB family transcriptional regulator, redox-sensing transcriptional regulator